MAKVKRTVKHPRLMMMVEGKLQRVPVGTTISIEDSHISKRNEKFLVTGKEGESKSVGGALSTAEKKAAAEAEAKAKAEAEAAAKTK